MFVFVILTKVYLVKHIWEMIKQQILFKEEDKLTVVIYISITERTICIKASTYCSSFQEIYTPVLVSVLVKTGKYNRKKIKMEINGNFYI